MRYRLSTMLIVVAGVAAAFSQHASPVRFTVVATAELAAAVAWIAAKGYPFPWRAAFALVLVGDLYGVASYFHTAYKSAAGVTLGHVIAIPAIAVVLFFLLLLPILMLFVFYQMADSFFGRDRVDLPARQGTETRKSSD